MQKQKIAIISVLKPVNDSRSFEKMACTLSANKSFEIHLFGFPSDNEPQSHHNVHLHPSKRFRRISFYRFMIPLKTLFSLIKLKPQLVICSTHELQFVTCLYKIIFGFKISYDIQENYYFNLKYQHVYPRLIKDILAVFVRLKEVVLSPIFDHFILAEKAYANELSFIGKRYTIVENKAIIPDNWNKDSIKQPPVKILFSGTITKSNGILKAFALMKVLHEQQADFQFTIAGHCSNQKIWEMIHREEYDFVTLEISKDPIPHATILSHVMDSNFGLISYDLNKSNQSCMPTKVYEYAALGLPMIYESGAIWSEFIKENGVGIQVDFDKIDSGILVNEINNFKTLSSDPVHKIANWNSEIEKLKSTIDNLLI